MKRLATKRRHLPNTYHLKHLYPQYKKNTYNSLMVRQIPKFKMSKDLNITPQRQDTDDR